MYSLTANHNDKEKLITIVGKKDSEYNIFSTSSINDFGDYMSTHLSKDVELDTAEYIGDKIDYRIQFVAKLIGDGIYEEYKSHKKFRITTELRLTTYYIEITPVG